MYDAHNIHWLKAVALLIAVAAPQYTKKQKKVQLRMVAAAAATAVEQFMWSSFWAVG